MNQFWFIGIVPLSINASNFASAVELVERFWCSTEFEPADDDLVGWTEDEGYEPQDAYPGLKFRFDDEQPSPGWQQVLISQEIGIEAPTYELALNAMLNDWDPGLFAVYDEDQIEFARGTEKVLAYDDEIQGYKIV